MSNIPRIESIITLKELRLLVLFDDGYKCIYNIKEDIPYYPDFSRLQTEPDLFEKAKLDKSRACVIWDDGIDLPSDILREYGKPA